MLCARYYCYWWWCCFWAYIPITGEKKNVETKKREEEEVEERFLCAAAFFFLSSTSEFRIFNKRTDKWDSVSLITRQPRYNGRIKLSASTHKAIGNSHGKTRLIRTALAAVPPKNRKSSFAIRTCVFVCEEQRVHRAYAQIHGKALAQFSLIGRLVWGEMLVQRDIMENS